MKIAKRHLIFRITVLVSIGVAALLLESWAINNPTGYYLLGRFVLVILVLFLVLAEAAKGNLKSSSEYKASYSEASEVGYVQVLIFIYFIAFSMVVLLSILNDVNIYRYIESPIAQYITISPVFILLFIGKYKLEKLYNSV